MSRPSFSGKETPILPRLPKGLPSPPKPPVTQLNVSGLQNISGVPNYVNLVYEEPYVLPPENLMYDFSRRRIGSRSHTGSIESAYARRKSIASIISTKLTFESQILWRFLIILVVLLIVFVGVSVFFYAHM